MSEERKGPGKPILNFRVWYTGDWFQGERYQVTFGYDAEHAKRAFSDWAGKMFVGHTWEIVNVD